MSALIVAVMPATRSRALAMVFNGCVIVPGFVSLPFGATYRAPLVAPAAPPFVAPPFVVPDDPLAPAVPPWFEAPPMLVDEPLAPLAPPIPNVPPVVTGMPPAPTPLRPALE